jgi:general secretion pathway protein D
MRTRALAAVLCLVFVFLCNNGFAKTDRVALNFDDVDISVFLKTMSEITGKSFVLTDKVRGKISFVSSKDVPVEKVYDVVLSILRAQGWYAVQQENNVVQIYPAQEALKMSGTIFYGTDRLADRSDAIVTQIIPLQHVNANEVVNVIRPLFGADVLISPYAATNVVIVNGSPPTINLILAMVEFIDTQIPIKQSGIHIYRLENSKAEAMAKTLSSLASSIPEVSDKQPQQQQQPPQQQQRLPGSEASFLSERFRVVANVETNSIIIISAPQDYEKILEIIKELDQKREQVLVEALIIEILVDDQLSYGFDWRVLTETGLGVDALAQANTGLVQESIATGGLPGLTVGLLNGTIPSVYAILSANREKTNFKILSTPELVTIDNQEALISIVEQIPFLTSSRVDENNNVIQTYDYKDVGISLKLTPHVNKNGYITMDIKQQIQKIVESTRTLENPSVFKREITSQVTVKSERTIVLGGLIRDDTTEIEQKVPLLGDIPLIGLFFRKKSSQTQRTNLLVFITPYIITEDQVIGEISEEKKVKQEEFEESLKKKRKKEKTNGKSR